MTVGQFIQWLIENEVSMSAVMATSDNLGGVFPVDLVWVDDDGRVQVLA